MPSREYRAYNGSGTPQNYFKDIEGSGTALDPDKSGVVLREGGATGTIAGISNKDGTLLETLHYISNNINAVARSANIALSTTTVTTTLTTVLDIICADYNQISLRLNNTGSVVLNDLQVQGFEASGFLFDYQLLAAASITGSYGANTGKQSGNTLIPVVDTSGTLPAIPGSSKSGILLNVKFYQRIRIQASVASGTTNLAIAGTLMC